MDSITEGLTELGVKTKGSNRMQELALEWKHEGECVAENTP